MKRAGRIAVIVKMFTDKPNHIFKLNDFCKKFNTAKSTISEDINIVRNALYEMELGNIITIPGPTGGVKFVPFVTKEFCIKTQKKLCKELNNKFRFLGGGFLYTSDLMFEPSFVYEMASIFAHIFASRNADYVVTIETKGIPLALMTAKLLNIPTVVVRREPKISEGPTISINYFSGSAGRMQKMSVSKKSVIPGSKALIIDDFMRAGGSIKGIYELLSELDVEVAGVGVAIASTFPETKKISNYEALVFMGNVDEKNLYADIVPNDEISKKYLDCKYSEKSV